MNTRGQIGRAVMRCWAIRWREEMKYFGKTAVSEMCLRRAIDWRGPVKKVNPQPELFDAPTKQPMA